ncbi:pesticin C-terminus-like muramidase, partial [Thermodesulfovibrionales bacterium]|nr:pesticin C-terminus-like muramidase [Thermodesulfovibrionales bacterium]
LSIFAIVITSLLVFSGSAVSAAPFGIGDTVEVQNTAAAGGLAVRSTPAGNEIARMPDGTQGEIIGGPQHATLRGTTFTWWRIRWANEQVGWSAERWPGGVWYLRKVAAAPSRPTITSPGTATRPGQVITDLTPTLRWNSLDASVTDFAVAISRYPYGPGNVIYSSGWRSGRPTSYTVTRNLEQGTRYRWQLEVRNAAGSTLSNILYFQIEAVTPPPSAPVLSSPGTTSPPGQAITDRTPTLRWNSLDASVTDFAVAISRYPYGPGNVIYSSGWRSGRPTSYTVTRNLEQGTRYRWQLEVRNAAGSTLSNRIYFQIAGPPAPPGLTITSAHPSPSTVVAGETITIRYNVANPGAAITVLLGASIELPGKTTLNDPANDRQVTIVSGSSTHQRPFVIPADAPPGMHNLIVSLWEDVNNNARIDAEDQRLASRTLTGTLQVVLSPVTPPPVAPPDCCSWLQVPIGQLTFDLEGKEYPPPTSRRIHWPGGDSGVTIGRGYDIGQWPRNTVITDLKAAGVCEYNVGHLAAAAGLTGNRANQFVLDHKNEPWATITKKQQHDLFINVYRYFVQVAREGVNNATRWGIRFDDGSIKMYPSSPNNARSFDDLPLAVQDVAVDMAFNVGRFEFTQNNWGGIFQMNTWQEMANYIEGNIRGYILDDEGKLTPEGWRAETILGNWRDDVRTRVDKLVEVLRSVSNYDEPTVPLEITRLEPSEIITSAAPYRPSLSLYGSGLYAVNQISFVWSGAVSGNAVWNQGDADWNTKVMIDSDTSMTIQPRVVESSPTWSGTVNWTVTLRDTTGATASKTFTVTLEFPEAKEHAKKAAQWAIDRVGTEGWRFFCLNFVANAYDQTASGRSSANILANELANANLLKKYSLYNAPVGALVFWYACPRANENFGHVGIYVGDGYVVHAAGKYVQKDNMAGRQPRERCEHAGNAPYRGWAHAPVNWQIGNGGRNPDFSGRVISNVRGLANATVTIRGNICYRDKDYESYSVTTDAYGNFKFWGLYDGLNYTITPSKQDYSFTLKNDHASEYFQGSPPNLSVNFSANFVGEKQDPVIVTFPDPNLEAAIREALGIGTEVPIYRSHLKKLTTLRALGRGISDLTGLEYAANLEKLLLGWWFGRNYITDLTPLADLTNLRVLCLWNNDVTNLAPLAGLTNLTMLELGQNQITDIGLLAGLTRLEGLHLSGNQIIYLGPLANLTNLTELNLSENRITDISPLSKLVNLEKLWLENNQIIDLKPLADLTNLFELYLSDNQITDIIPLTNLTNLTILELSENQITDVSPLSELVNLEELRLGGNEIVDISPLVANHGLSEGDEIDLRGNPLSDASLRIYIPQLQARGIVASYYGVAHPVITSPLEITPVKEFYQARDSLIAQFTIANKGTELITFNVLVVGGRDPAGNIVDFDKVYNITLNPGDSYNYLGSLILPDIIGRYYFFIVYQTLDGKWHSGIDVKIDGQIIDGIEAATFTTRDILVRHREYIGIAPQIATWEEISGPWEKEGRRLSQIAVHPDNPEIIYAVVDGAHWLWRRYHRLYRSTNGGVSWASINEGLPRKPRINAIAIAPSDPHIMYLHLTIPPVHELRYQERSGIYKSKNAGLTWEWRTDAPAASVFSLLVHPTNPKIVYAGTFGRGIWRTINGGQCWEQIWYEEAIIPGVATFFYNVNALAISPANPDVIYALVYRWLPRVVKQLKGVYATHRLIKYDGGEYDDGGENWENIKELSEIIGPSIADIAVDNRNADLVYILTHWFWVGRSTDRGKRWDSASGFRGENPLPRGRRGTSIAIHPDSPDVIYVAREGAYSGVYFSPDAGANWFGTELQSREVWVNDLVFASDADSLILYAAGPDGLWAIDLAKRKMIIQIDSPGELRVHDSHGRVTGLVDGVVRQEIPHSVYDAENKIVTILSPIDNYHYLEVAGIEKGTYGLTTISVIDGQTEMFAITDVPTTEITTHRFVIDPEVPVEAGVTMKTDDDGVEGFEEQRILHQPRATFTFSPEEKIRVNQTV